MAPPRPERLPPIEWLLVNVLAETVAVPSFMMPPPQPRPTLPTTWLFVKVHWVTLRLAPTSLKMCVYHQVSNAEDPGCVHADVVGVFLCFAASMRLSFVSDTLLYG